MIQPAVGSNKGHVSLVVVAGPAIFNALYAIWTRVRAYPSTFLSVIRSIISLSHVGFHWLNATYNTSLTMLVIFSSIILVLFNLNQE